MKLLSVLDVSKVTGLAVSTIQKMAQRGEIAGAHKVGRDWLIPAASVKNIPHRNPGRQPRKKP